ncbi:MAG: DUF2169 domain-containing protein [Polyangiaceae bacterium]|nr:DUF2169 domain-containing protein [Polyangiaceae bacterium]
MAFRAGGQLRIAVIVKATFIVTPDRPMLWIDPAPLSTEAVLGTASAADYDLAPWKPQVDVLLRGSAKAVGSVTSPSLPVRLMISRGASIVLDKKVNLPNPTKAARLPLAGDFGAVAPHAPVRRALVSFESEVEFLSDPIVSFPPDFRWEYFNVAPLNQRVPKLHGDEWVRLEGTHFQLPYLQSELPGIQALAKVFAPTDEYRSGRPLPLVADTLTIDVDRTRAWLVWRASFPVERESDIATFHVVAGAETGAKPAEFPRSYDEVRRAPVTGAAPKPKPSADTPVEKGKTLTVDDCVPIAPPTPFASPAAKSWGKQLAALSPADFARLRGAAGVSQPPANPKPAPEPAVTEAPTHYEKRHVHTLDPEAGAVGRIPLPFQKAPASPLKSQANAPIPISRPSPPVAPLPRAAPSPPAAKSTPSYIKSTFNLTLAPDERAAPVLLPFSVQPARPPTNLSLGDHFLKAMERAAAKPGAPRT